MSLRADLARAKAGGIDIRVRGWRKKLARIELTALQNEAAAALVADANKRSRLRRLEKEFPGACPHEFHPEMEIVGPFYVALLTAGFDAHLEVSTPSSFHRSGFMRIDIGITNGGRLIAAIECKRTGKKLGKDTRQANAYRALRDDHGIHIYFVNSAQGAAQTLDDLKLLLPRYGA